MKVLKISIKSGIIDISDQPNDVVLVVEDEDTDSDSEIRSYLPNGDIIKGDYRDTNEYRRPY